jgi:thiol:disulfide interchange protein DsbA
MKNILISISTFAIYIFSIIFAGNLIAAEKYKLITPPQPTQTGNKIEVIEIFWYGCPHCYTFEPYIENWLETKENYIEFRRIPGVLGNRWIPHARAFYTAEKLGVIEKIHIPLFDAIHKNNEEISNEKELRKFFEKNGVKTSDFDKVYHSAEIDKKVMESFTAGQKYKVTGVPAVIVNGKYGTSASMAGSYQNLITTINQLAKREWAKVSAN